MVKKLLVASALLILSVVIAFSQGRGGGGGQGQGQGGGQNQRGMQGGQQAGQGGMQTGAGQGQMDRDRVRLNTQQRDQARTCDRLADGVRKQARTMAKNSGSSKLSQAELGRQRDQLRERVRAIEREHERLMTGIDPAQRQQFQEQIRNMNQYRQQVNNQLQQIDGRLDSPNPDHARIAEHAREMEQVMKRWRDAYGGLSEN